MKDFDDLSTLRLFDKRFISIFSTTVKCLAFLVSIFTIMRIVKFVPTMPPIMYYSLWGLFCLCILARALFDTPRINLSMFLFIVICFFSIVLNQIDPKYNIWLRYAGFLLIVCSIGPLFDSKWLYEFRYYCFHYILDIILLVSIASFLIYCIYPSLMLTERGNLFGGVTLHSMQMGPIAGISTVYMIHNTLIRIDFLNTKGKYLYFTLIAISFLACILAGSRSAIIATVLASIIYLRFYYRGRIKQFLAIVLLSIAVLSLTSPLWWGYTETVQKKAEISAKRGGFISGRSYAWEARIDEFSSNPLLGHGFATTGEGGERGDDGMVEPGNGWLFILSSTGIISFLLFVSLYFKSIYRLVKMKMNESNLILSLLIFIGIHINAEGYTLSSGIFLFYVLWLVLGYSLSYLSFGTSMKSVS